MPTVISVCYSFDPPSTGTLASDPARCIRRQKRNYVRNIFGFTDSLQCLHLKCYVTPRLGLREIRHVGVDHAWRACVYADALRAKNGGPVLNQSLERSLRRGVGKDRRLV